MRLIRQIVALLCLCVLGAVLTVLVSGTLSLHSLTQRYQTHELRLLTRLLEQEVLDSAETPPMVVWLPPMLQANGVRAVVITLDDAPLFRYQDPDWRGDNAQLTTVRMAGERHPTLHLAFSVVPALTLLTSELPLLSLAIGFGIILFGTWIALSWLQRQLRGVELLARRGQHILSGTPGRLRHDPRQEWPVAASEAMTWLQHELADARKERSRFDTFIRRNVFIDKDLGIGNRIFFDNRLEAALADAEYSAGAVLLVEIEGLESLPRNQDEAAVGQALLLQAGQWIAEVVQRHTGAMQGRYASNVLGILLPNISKQETLTHAEQLWRQLGRLDWPTPLDPDRHLFIGAVCYQPGEWLAQVEEEAEMALRGARLQQEGGFFLYDKLLRVEADGKGSVRWRTLLERQFGRGQLTYQLQTAWRSTPPAPMLHELLARLPDGKGKLLPAASFITMVDKVGMQRELDRLMMTNALALLPPEGSVPLALNLHPQSLLDHAFRHTLLMALLRLGKRRAASLVIELNEGLVHRHLDALRAPLRELRLFGVQFAVDHAGQDVVSTHYIKEFELAYLKIHPSLVRDIARRPLNQMAVRSLVGGCEGQTQVIAVGIESESEWKVLQTLGVSGGQGFWLDQEMKSFVMLPSGDRQRG